MGAVYGTHPMGGGAGWQGLVHAYIYIYININIYIYVKQCVRSTSEMRQYICLCRCQTRVCVKIHVSIWNLTYMSNCEGSRLLACAWVPVCPCARGSGLCPGARASDVLGACCLSATRTLYSPEVSRLQAVAVCLLIPQTVCPH